MDRKHDSIDKQHEQTPSAAELQQRLQETRRTVNNTVEELKTTMNTQYNQAKDRATQSLDWKLQMQKYPLAACVGALAFGFLAGRSLAAASDEDDDYTTDTGRLSHDYTTMHGGQQVPSESRMHSITQRVLPPQTRARMAHRVEDVLGNLSEQFLGELTRVGREVVVPTLIGALTSKLNSMGSHTSSNENTMHQHSAGGTGSFGAQSSSGPTYQGRAL